MKTHRNTRNLRQSPSDTVILLYIAETLHTVATIPGPLRSPRNVVPALRYDTGALRTGSRTSRSPEVDEERVWTGCDGVPLATMVGGVELSKVEVGEGRSERGSERWEEKEE